MKLLNFTGASGRFFQVLIKEFRPGLNASTPNSASYGYDLAGNLLLLNGGTFASYDGANKISSLAGGTISYDLDGNTTSVTATGVPASTLTWNTKSKIKTLAAGSSSIALTYTWKGQRAVQQQGSVKRFYVFAGDALLGEIKSGSPQVAYTWGPDGLVSERLFRVQYITAVEAPPPGEPITDAPVAQVEDSTGLSGYATDQVLCL